MRALSAAGGAPRFPLRGAGRRADCTFFGKRPEHHEHFPDMLDRMRIERAADVVDHFIAFMPVTDEHPNFYQLVANETEIDFLDQRRRESSLADGDVWPQMVGTGSQRSTGGGR